MVLVSSFDGRRLGSEGALVAKSRESFERRQRERAKSAKAQAKRERRMSSDDSGPSAPIDRVDVDENAVIAELAELHAVFDREAITFEEFEARRSELVARLHVD